MTSDPNILSSYLGVSLCVLKNDPSPTKSSSTCPTKLQKKLTHHKLPTHTPPPPQPLPLLPSFPSGKLCLTTSTNLTLCKSNFGTKTPCRASAQFCRRGSTRLCDRAKPWRWTAQTRSEVAGSQMLVRRCRSFEMGWVKSNRLKCNINMTIIKFLDIGEIGESENPPATSSPSSTLRP